MRREAYSGGKAAGGKSAGGGVGFRDAIARLAEGYYYGRGREKNLRTALQLWERAAALGNAEAQYYRGVCCFYGDGVPRDKEAAFHLWEQAAEQGHVGACRSLETLRGRES